MPHPHPRSLSQAYPRRWDVPASIGGAAVVLVVAHTLPFMSIEKLIFFQDDYTLLKSVQGMWAAAHYFLAAVIFFFSIVFPFAKLAALMGLWFVPVDASRRRSVLGWLGVLGKWSMLDVFVIALVIVLTQSKGMVNAAAGPGVYLFAGAILLSMVVSLVVERLARRAERAGEEASSS